MDKPFQSFAQQVDKLENEYGLIINDKGFAKEAIASISYYDLINGYQFIYMDANDKFKDGITIEHLYTTHTFNKNIQGVLMKYATYVENSFKNLLAHVIAEQFTEDEEIYLNIQNYQRSRVKKQRYRLRRVLKNMKDTCRNCNNTPTRHYIDTKNHIPPWILFRNISFSNTTNLFSFLKRNEKEMLFDYISIFNNDLLDFQNKVNVYLDALNLVRKFRNKIAHNLNFLTYRNSKLNKSANVLFKDTLILPNEINKTRKDVWAMVLSITLLLNNKYLTQNFLAEFQSFMELNTELHRLYCRYAGIPLDFDQRIRNHLKKFN